MKPKPTSSNHNPELQEAIALHQSGKLSEAATLYKKLLDIFPENTKILTNLGTIALQQGNLEEGVRLTEKSLEIDPNQSFALNNLANVLLGIKRLDDAIASYDRAIALNPNFAEAYCNRGIALQELNQLDEALASYDRAIALKPDYADANWNASILKILLGDFEKGWKLFEWGWKTNQRVFKNNFHQPLWLGEQSLSGITLLIHAEQGLGDVVHFCRYAPMAEALGAKVIIEAPQALISLISTLKGNFTIVEKGKELPLFDLHCPIMSLPLAFKTTVETIPSDVPYLFVDEEKKRLWSEKLGNKTRPRIGLVWSGYKGHQNDNNRSLLLKQFEPILRLPFEFHSLQKEIRAEDKSTLSEFNQIHQHQDELMDFSDTAALINEMDIVISVDTSVAHVAGAIGKEICILLPSMPDYRWMLDRADSPWYPTATLFRQPKIGDWESVITEVANLLKQYKLFPHHRHLIAPTSIYKLYQFILNRFGRIFI